MRKRKRKRPSWLPRARHKARLVGKRGAPAPVSPGAGKALPPLKKGEEKKKVGSEKNRKTDLVVGNREFPPTCGKRCPSQTVKWGK